MWVGTLGGLNRLDPGSLVDGIVHNIIAYHQGTVRDNMVSVLPVHLAHKVPQVEAVSRREE